MRRDPDCKVTCNEPETPTEAPFDGATSEWDPWLVAMAVELSARQPRRLN